VEINRQHDRKAFDCGLGELNQFSATSPAESGKACLKDLCGLLGFSTRRSS